MRRRHIRPYGKDTFLEWPVLHLPCQLSADPFKIALYLVALHLMDTSQGRLNIGQHILSSYAFQEVRA
jgi:hypothetical protein